MEEVDLCPVNDPKDPEESEKEIGKAGIGGAYIFSDGSFLESGNVGGGAFVVGTDGREQEVECGISVGLGTWRWCGMARSPAWPEVSVEPGRCRKKGSHTSRLEGSHRGSQKGRQNRKSEIQTPAEDG